MPALPRPSAWRLPVRLPFRGGGLWRRPGLARSSLARSGPLRSWSSRGAWAALALVAFPAATWGISRSALLDVDHIEVTGGFQVDEAEAVAASGVHRGDPLLTVDADDVRARLEALPWVREAAVERGFPNRVRIRLTERLPTAAAARSEGGFALLDETGRVLAERPQRPDGLPEVRGAGEPPAPGGWLRSARPALLVMAALPDGLRRDVSTVALDGVAVTARVGDREVRFGAADELEAKASALAALLEHLGDREVDYVDVRVPSAPVVAPVAGSSEAAAAPRTTAALRD